MRKSRYRILVSLICFSLCFSFCSCRQNEVLPPSTADGHSSDVSLKPKQTKSVTVSVLPSPPHYKVITDEESINAICKAVNTAEKEKLPSAEPKGGWKIRLQFSDGTEISLIGEELKINDREYKVSSTLEAALLQIYNNSPAEEKPYTG